MTDTHTDEGRTRPARADKVAGERRRRNASSLNRMAQYKLDFIPEDLLDKDNFVYRWINDTPGRLRMATKMDDYEQVSASELGPGFAIDNTDSEGGDTIRMYTGVEAGQPVYAYLCKKPRDYWESDNEEIVARREAMMEGRVFHGEGGESEGGRTDLSEGVSYVPAGVQMGGSAQRKRGPVARNFK